MSEKSCEGKLKLFIVSCTVASIQVFSTSTDIWVTLNMPICRELLGNFHRLESGRPVFGLCQNNHCIFMCTISQFAVLFTNCKHCYCNSWFFVSLSLAVQCACISMIIVGTWRQLYLCAGIAVHVNIICWIIRGRPSVRRSVPRQWLVKWKCVLFCEVYL